MDVFMRFSVSCASAIWMIHGVFLIWHPLAAPFPPYAIAFTFASLFAGIAYALRRDAS